MRRPNRIPGSRRGSSYLEVQVAMVLLAIGISGLYSLSVIQTRQTSRLEQMLPATQVSSINPVSGASDQEIAWAKKLGVYADVQTDSVAPPVATYPLNTGFIRIVDNEDLGEFTVFQAPGSQAWFEYTGMPEQNKDSIVALATNGSFGSYAEFTFNSVPAGDYEVLLFHDRVPPLGTAVPHQIYDGSDLIDTVLVDQTVDDNDYAFAWKWWKRLGVYTFHNGSIRVRMLDTPDTGDYIIADAVMVRCRRSFNLLAAPLETSQGGATVTVEMN